MKGTRAGVETRPGTTPTLARERRDAARNLRDVRARMKAARPLVATTPGFTEFLRSDWQKAARIYTLFGITEAIFRYGVPAKPLGH